VPIDLLGYYVFRNPAGDDVPPVRLNSIPLTGTAFTDVGLNCGTTYLYRLMSVDTASNESVFTGPLEGRTADCGTGSGDSGGKKRAELEQIEKEIVAQGTGEGIAKVASLGLEGALVALALPLSGPSGTEYVGYTLHTDHLGSVRLITDAVGNVVSRHAYLPFGQEVGPIVRSPSSHKFTGHERDLDTGLDYMLARYYGAGMGRFLTTDPNMKGMILQIPLTWNPYTYGRNNPVNFLDRDGEAAAGFAGHGNRPDNGVYAILRQIHGAPGVGPAKPFTTFPDTTFGRSEVHRAATWLKDQARASPTDQTVLLGHSMGAHRAIDTARLLGEWNTRVDLLILSDPVNPSHVNISDNVRLTINGSSPKSDQQPRSSWEAC
jgi:RHS repeat-associated protein